MATIKDQIRAEIERLVKNNDSLSEQPVKGLEKEIDNYISRHFYGSQTQGFFASRTDEEPNYVDIALTARHFAEWGAEHLKK